MKKISLYLNDRSNLIVNFDYLYQIGLNQYYHHHSDIDY